MGKNPLVVRLACCGVLLLLTLVFALLLSTISPHLPNETAFAEQNLIRFHVLANSNLPKDQNLKLLVRDAVLQETQVLLNGVTGKELAYDMLNNSNDYIQEVARRVVIEEGFDYPVEVKVGYFPFPKREYGDLSLPAGWYDAVRVEIGEAVGDNWWCVLFPPLCLADLELADNTLLQLNQEARDNRFAVRLKFWDHFSQTRYARTIQKWWQASAASYPVLPN